MYVNVHYYKFDYWCRCSRDCSLTAVVGDDGDCKNGHPLRRERVFVADLQRQVDAFVITATWEELSREVEEHTRHSNYTTAYCCIKCSPRYRAKVTNAPPGVITIPIIIGSDGLPLTHGKFGANRPVWLNTVKNLAAANKDGQQWVGSMLGGPTLPPNLRTSFEPVRTQLISLANPFWCEDKNGEEKLCRVVVLGVSGDGQGIKKLSGAAWNGKWCCPSCKLEFIYFCGRNIVPDFRVHLSRGHPLRLDPRFGPQCLLNPPEVKTHAWHERQAARVSDVNAGLRPGQKPKHSQGHKNFTTPNLEASVYIFC